MTTVSREELSRLLSRVSIGSIDAQQDILDMFARLAATPADDGVREATIEECAMVAEQGLMKFSSLEIARAIPALSTKAKP